MKATVFISKDEEITKQYTSPLEPTQIRREKLKEVCYMSKTLLSHSGLKYEKKIVEGNRTLCLNAKINIRFFFRNETAPKVIFEVY